MIPSRKRKARITLAVLAAAVLVLSLMTAFGVIDFRKRPQAADAGTSVRFIDVGQGDCTLAFSEGHALLIDTGEYDDRDRVISYIKSLGITRLDCLILTHPHSDHIGEASDIIEAFEVDRLLIPKTDGEGYPYDRLKEAASEKGVTDYNGTGPFIFKEWKQDQYIHLVRNPNYKPRDEEPSGFSGRKEALVEDLWYYFVPDEATRISGLLSGQYDIIDE